jgi:hypothetical protein
LSGGTVDGEPEEPPLSKQLRGWLEGSGPRTLGGLIDLFGEKAFAVVFVVLLAVPALPLPTGGATHEFEVIAALLAAQLVVGRDEIWLPERWRARELGGEGQQKFVNALTKLIERLEGISRPRLAFLFGSRLSNAVFGLVVIGGCAAAFVAPPFTGLDTLPALGIVLISLAVLLEDVAIAIVGAVVLMAGVVLEITLGKAAVNAVRDLF